MPETLHESLRDVARFRNRLVHIYWEVEDGRVYEYLQTALEDFHAFARAVAEHPWREG